MPKVLFQCYLEVEQHEYIEQLAEEKKRSMASLVREMIDRYREQEKEKTLSRTK